MASTQRLSRAVSDRNHTWGPPDAAVTLVEYPDFECPHCARAYPIVRRLRDELGPSLRFVSRHFPLVFHHAPARLAAEAAEAAAAQGGFWPMHDVLFEHQDALDLESVLGYAAAPDLDGLARAVTEAARRPVAG